MLSLKDTARMNISGNAATATKWQSARKITLSGVKATQQIFDGTGDVTIPVTEVPRKFSNGKRSECD